MAPVLKRHLFRGKGLYKELYGLAESLQSQVAQHGREMALKELDVTALKNLGVAHKALGAEPSSSLPARLSALFDQLCALACKQAETTSDPARMTAGERKIHDDTGAFGCAATFAALLSFPVFPFVVTKAAKDEKKMLSIVKAAAERSKKASKQALGKSALDVSESKGGGGGKKRKRRTVFGMSDDDEEEDETGQRASAGGDAKEVVKQQEPKNPRGPAPVKGDLLSAGDLGILHGFAGTSGAGGDDDDDDDDDDVALGYDDDDDDCIILDIAGSKGNDDGGVFEVQPLPGHGPTSSSSSSSSSAAVIAPAMVSTKKVPLKQTKGARGLGGLVSGISNNLNKLIAKITAPTAAAAAAPAGLTFEQQMALEGEKQKTAVLQAQALGKGPQ